MAASSKDHSKNRVTISFDPDVESKIHAIRGLLIQETSESWYFSQVLNMMLIDALKRRSKKQWIKTLKEMQSK